MKISSCSARLSLVAAVAAVSAVPTGMAMAQEAAPTLEEVIVSARKRNESLQDVPLSIQVFTAAEMQRANVLDLNGVANFAPGVTLFENVDRGYGQVFIRGMQNTPPVGDTSRELASIFLDGVYFTGGVSGISTNNIERVEVIKGPQSALLGRSTFSGAINFITKTPAMEPGGSISLTGASDEDYRFQGSLEGPLIEDKLAGRIEGRYLEYGGQYTNSLNGEALGEREDTAISGQLFFTPTERITAKFTASLLEQDDGPAASTLTGKVGTHNFTSASGRTFYRGEVPLEGPIAQNQLPRNDADWVTLPPVPVGPFTDFDRIPRRSTGMDREFSFYSLDLTAELGDSGYQLTYLGGYSEEEARRAADFELSAENNYFLGRSTDSESTSHELRLTSPDSDRFRWLAGLYYLEQELFERDPGGIFGFDLGFFAPLGQQPGQVVVLAGPRTTVDREIENSAIFGAVSFDITEQFTVSLEGRYQVDDLTDTLNRDAGETLSGDTKSFLPRAIAEYQLSESVMLYAVAAKGLRPTTINSQFAARTDSEQAAIRAAFPELDIAVLAPEEEIWSYEIGAKTQTVDGRGTANVNFYYSDWTDRQNLQSLLTDINGDGAPDSTLVTVSGTDVDIMGIELETNYLITPQWYVSLTAAWNDSELTDAGQDANIARFFLQETPNGQRLSQTPEWSGTLISQYTGNFGSGDLDWFVRGEGIYVGSRYASSLNLAETGDSIDVNLRFGIQSGRYSVTAFAENILDDDTFESIRSNADCASSAGCALSAYEVMLARQRSYGVTLQIEF
ncbi:MAG: TonB-dependent receptor [Congregibacter sp.]